jgi:hypothetical protein
MEFTHHGRVPTPRLQALVERNMRPIMECWDSLRRQRPGEDLDLLMLVRCHGERLRMQLHDRVIFLNLMTELAAQGATVPDYKEDIARPAFEEAKDSPIRPASCRDALWLYLHDDRTDETLFLALVWPRMMQKGGSS